MGCIENESEIALNGQELSLDFAILVNVLCFLSMRPDCILTFVLLGECTSTSNLVAHLIIFFVVHVV